jgi:2-polyprenyl-3-methyl-5-hydroxy-6-metoxy-1,4-benzoquinol methylase
VKLETERDVNEWIAGARALAVVGAWSRLGLWERLRGGPVARKELPVDARALAVTVPILAHVGLVITDGDRVGLTATAERLVASGSMPTERNLDSLADLARTADVLRDGGPVRDANGKSKATSGGTLPTDPVATERFLDMLYRISDGAAQETFTWLGSTLPKKASVLDLGGGHGRYARAFADAGHEVTLFDQPMVIDIAKKRHGDALRYLGGDFHTIDSFGGPYDLVMLCNVVHGESDAANASIVARAAKGLKAGGRIAIRDMFLDEQEQNPSSAVFFGMVMLFYTEGGTSPTMRQAHEWFARAGLTDVRTTTFETHQIITARKPA